MKDDETQILDPVEEPKHYEDTNKYLKYPVLLTNTNVNSKSLRLMQEMWDVINYTQRMKIVVQERKLQDKMRDEYLEDAGGFVYFTD